jgi:hypothetical protein
MNPFLPIITCLLVPSTLSWAMPVQDDVSKIQSTEVISEVEMPKTEIANTEVSETEVDRRVRERRVREILNEANTRYWKNRARTKTLPEGRWNPQQAGWIDASGQPLVINWPWWAW